MGYTRREIAPRWLPDDVITFTGDTGVGTSTILTEFERMFEGNCRKNFVSAGSIFRGFAKELGMSIEEFGQHAKDHPEEGWDKKCDETIAWKGCHNHTFAEGRLVQVFIPGAFHVLLTCGIETRAERRRKDPNYQHLSIHEVAELILERDRVNNERYERLYPGCLWPESDYDLIIATDKMSISEELHAILEGHAEWLARMRQQGKIKYTV